MILQTGKTQGILLALIAGNPLLNQKQVISLRPLVIKASRVFVCFRHELTLYCIVFLYVYKKTTYALHMHMFYMYLFLVLSGLVLDLSVDSQTFAAL